MLDDIYNARILEFAGNIPLTGVLDHPQATAKAHSKLCGSKVSVSINMDGDTVSGFAHEVKACAMWWVPRLRRLRLRKLTCWPC